MPEFPQGPGPIDFRGFVHIGRHILQPRKENHHDIADALPDRDHHQQRNDEMRILQPFLRIEAQLDQERVGEPEPGIEDRVRHVHNNGPGRDDGQKMRQPKQLQRP
ncbi:hypothetical protein D1872_251130 [compost metagenome]